MFHAAAVASASTSAHAAKGAFADAWRWARVGREALGLLSLPLLRPGQGIDGLEVSDSTFEEWEAVQSQFEERVRSGTVRMI